MQRFSVVSPAMVDPHTSETLIILPQPPSCRKLRHQKQHKHHRCVNIRLARFKRKNVLRGHDIRKSNRKRKENSKWLVQRGPLRTHSSLTPQPEACHPPALMAQCPLASSDCVPPVGSSAVCSTEQFTPPPALALPIPTSPGQCHAIAQLACSRKESIGSG